MLGVYVCGLAFSCILLSLWPGASWQVVFCIVMVNNCFFFSWISCKFIQEYIYEPNQLSVIISDQPCSIQDVYVVWDTPMTNDFMCSVCLNTIDSQNLCKLECGHEYHFQCITNWCQMCRNKNKDPSCPICRVKIKTEKVKETPGITIDDISISVEND